MIRFEDVERKVERHHPDADLDLLRRAYIYSAKAHKDQVRASGEPYLIHPLSVAAILADMKMDVATVSTGLLHDVVEDTLASTGDISKVFGEEVANLVTPSTRLATSSPNTFEMSPVLANVSSTTSCSKPVLTVATSIFMSAKMAATDSGWIRYGSPDART